MRFWRARPSSLRRSRRATPYFAARRNATIVTATAAPAKIHCSQILPRAISERPQIRCFLTMLSNNPMHEAMPPTRPDQDMSIPALAVFLPSATCSATLPQLMHDGAPLAAENMGRFQVPTLRNVDKRPNPDFVKAYG